MRTNTETHYVPWDQKARQGQIESRCGKTIRETQVAILATPTCQDCLRLDAEDARDLEALRDGL